MAGNSAAASATPLRREGARVLLLDEQGRLLMMRAHDSHRPSRSWWFTPGGGIEPGESAREAAARELAEETGLRVPAASLVGPVWDRTALFDFQSQPYVQHEVFFVARVRDVDGSDALRWTDTEHDTLDETAWLTPQEVAQATIEVFPAELRDDWAAFVHWNGQTVNLGEVSE